MHRLTESQSTSATHQSFNSLSLPRRPTHDKQGRLQGSHPPLPAPKPPSVHYHRLDQLPQCFHPQQCKLKLVSYFIRSSTHHDPSRIQLHSLATQPPTFAFQATKTHPTPVKQWYTGIVISHNNQSTDVDFSDKTMTLTTTQHIQTTRPRIQPIPNPPLFRPPFLYTNFPPSFSPHFCPIHSGLHEIIPTEPDGSLGKWGLKEPSA